jgi:hypothetical protein
MRGISDYLKRKLVAEIPGINEATCHLENGHQIIRINGNTAMVGVFASDNEVEAGIRRALEIPNNPSDPVAPAEAGHVTALPKVNLTERKPMANLSGGYKPGSLKALLQGVKDRTEAVMASAVADVASLHKALDHVENVAGDARATRDDIRAELGQFSNLGPLDGEPDEETEK